VARHCRAAQPVKVRMRAQKTKERILSAALKIFQDEGLHAPSAVDVASALSISPGHLYYHFKGKPELIAALYDGHRQEMAMILNGIASADPKLEELWTHVQIILEEIQDMRFLYRDLHAACAVSETLDKGMRTIVAGIRRALHSFLERMTKAKTLPAKEGLPAMLAEQMASAILTRLNLQEIDNPNEPPREQVARAALFVMTFVAAHVENAMPAKA
jgi:AcrR family transcriptional regulator